MRLSSPWLVVAVLLAPILTAADALAAKATSEAARAGVTRVRIMKGAHRLELLAGERVVVGHDVQIGPGGSGRKSREGDRVTPVGRYHVTMHQPSVYRTFLRLDYPNADDRARFAERQRRGELPKDARIGGDIGIHGPPQTLDDDERRALAGVDWTLGCIALSDEAIVEVARLVPDGTPVDIED